MTIEEINALTVSDVLQELLDRLGLEEDPNDGTLEDELVEYKKELIREEEARLEALRRKEWRQRFKAIKDLRMTTTDMGVTDANLKEWYKDIIKSKDETLLLALEAQAVITDARMLDEKNAEDNKLVIAKESFQALKNIDWQGTNNVAKLKAIVRDQNKVLRQIARALR